MTCRFGSVEVSYGRGDGLLERGVDAAVRADLPDQPGDRGAQPRLVAVAQQHLRQAVVGLGGEPGQRVQVGGVAGLDLLGLGQPQLAEQHLLELLRRTGVEAAAYDLGGLVGGALQRVREVALQLVQEAGVHVDSGAFGAGQQVRERQFDVAEDLVHAGGREVGGERPGQVEDGAGAQHQPGRAVGGRAAPRWRPARSAIP